MNMQGYKKAVLALALVLTSGAATSQNLFKNLLDNSGNRGDSTSNAASLIGNVTKAVKEPTQEEEIALGQQFSATLLGAKPLLNNPGVQRYVNTLGRWLATQTERPDLPWTFAVLDDNGYNAFATPGGYIFVTKGLLARMRSEAELAGVLSHEIAHVLQKHHLKAVRTSGIMGAIGDLATAKGGDNPQVKQFVKNAVLKAFASGLDQSDEFEADRIGVVIAARAGYDPYGLPAALQTLQGMSASDAGFGLIFSTHPAPAARLQQLDALMQEKFETLPANQGAPLKTRLTEFRK